MMHFPSITILGLGPGDPRLLTRQVWELLGDIEEIYVRTQRHPAVGALPAHLRVFSFDYLYNRADSFEAVYRQIVDEVLRLAQRPQGVVYAVPGHPFVAEATTPAILRAAREEGLSVRVLEGISFIEPVLSALEIDPLPNLLISDALEIAASHVPQFPPHLPLLIAQLYSRQVAADVKLTLMEVYPHDHPVRLVHQAGTAAVKVEQLSLYEIDRSPWIDWMTSLYVPSLPRETAFEPFQEVVAHLRSPEGCPWDREQNHQTLKPFLLEEAYELVEAIDQENALAMQEELGDLLLQVVLHAQIASEEGDFGMKEVLTGIHRKLVNRHPHVFGDLAVRDSSEVLRNWEKLKAEERRKNSEEPKGLLDGVPRALPALSQAQELQRRAARVGFDWPQIEGVLQKVAEELHELLAAKGAKDQSTEFGDILFSLVNLARWLKIDAESALRQANQRFRQRFAYIEQRVQEQGRNLADLTLAEMDALWDEAKQLE
ncbi:MAG: nucleoside triphosphate pyrophosphohydrolase [Anaerolineales bacterium]|nr:nucleoside triphosphate pyrophosphohydrolase [Anaerolineales bacterium]MDW8162032.1 nucleoside triphosphate pyrophosphohydrolase [Anaerolineales bacterium]